MKVSSFGNIRYEKGDWVEIIGNIPFGLKDKPKPLIGKVMSVDGEYVYVKPKGQAWECEFYHGELRPPIKKMRKLKLQKINKSTQP